MAKFVANVIEVYQAQSQDDRRSYPEKDFYRTKEEGAKACRGWGPMDPITRKALLLEDGTIWPLEGDTPIPLFNSCDEHERQQALNKLTPRERELLGLNKG